MPEGYTEQDVRHFAEYIAGHPDAELDPRHIAATAAVLGGLAREGRLLPEDTRTEWGVRSVEEAFRLVADDRKHKAGCEADWATCRCFRAEPTSQEAAE